MKKFQVLDSLLGVAVADALGVPAEFRNRATFVKYPIKDMVGYGTHNQPPGTWSDDSSMAFCLAESLIQGFNLKDLGDRFIRWMMEKYWTPHGKLFDMGKTTAEAIFRLQKGVDPVDAGGKGQYDNGNGSLMRILPLAYYLADQEDPFEPTHQVSCLTHGHPRSQMACGIYVSYALELMKGSSLLEAYQTTQKTCREYYYDRKIFAEERELFARVLEGDISALPEKKIESGGYVIHTLEASLWCLLNSSSYQETVLKAVNLGGDTDTTGAVAGGLAGIYYGHEAIPKGWVDQIARRDDIFDLAKRLQEALGRS